MASDNKAVYLKELYTHRKDLIVRIEERKKLKEEFFGRKN